MAKLVWRNQGECNNWLQCFSIVAARPNTTVGECCAFADSLVEECRERNGGLQIAGSPISPIR
jgi:hypothetical protein